MTFFDFIDDVHTVVRQLYLFGFDFGAKKSLALVNGQHALNVGTNDGFIV